MVPESEDSTAVTLKISDENWVKLVNRALVELRRQTTVRVSLAQVVGASIK